MSRRLTHELVEEALRRVDAGEHRADVAADLTAQGRPISARAIRRAQDARKRAPVLPKRPPGAKRAFAPPPSLPPLDALAEIEALIASTKGHQSALVGKQGYSGAGTLLVSLIKLRAAIERERAKPDADVSALLAKGPQAIAKIRAGAMVIEARERATGQCARCGGKLPRGEA